MTRRLIASLLLVAVCTSLTACTAALDLGNGVRMQLVNVPAGTFMMGSPPDEPGRHADEPLPREVTIARPFYIGTFEVTQREWIQVMGENPSWYRGDDLPVNRISWYQAQTFCEKATERTGRIVRLPTEAEWECACRAGTTTAYSFGDDPAALKDYAWYYGIGARQPSPVGLKAPNPWGIHDMHGNVWEWCQDVDTQKQTPTPTGQPHRTKTPTNDASHVLRGGSWTNDEASLRSARRIHRPGVMRSGYIGLRVVVEK